MNDAEMIWKLGTAASWLLTLFLLVRKAGGKPEAREITNQPLAVRPDIPGHDRYAPKDHVHAQYLTREECATRHATEERREDARTAEIKAMIGDLGKKVDGHNLEAEERARRIHERVGPIAEASAATRQVLDNHLEDHRSGRASHAG